jgi:uncharacterized paraquat-inducible protein A
MAARKELKTKAEMAYCPFCKEEFLSYQSAQSRCPRCGRRAHTLAQQRYLRIIALVVLGVLLIAAVVVGWFSR